MGHLEVIARYFDSALTGQVDELVSANVMVNILDGMGLFLDALLLMATATPYWSMSCLRRD